MLLRIGMFSFIAIWTCWLIEENFDDVQGDCGAIAAGTWTALEGKRSAHQEHVWCSVLRFGARVGAKALRDTMSVESGHTRTTMWTLRGLTRHAILSWAHTSGRICPPLGLHDTLQWSNRHQSCCLRQRKQGHLTQHLRSPRPSPATLPDSDHAGGVLLQRPYVDSGS